MISRTRKLLQEEKPALLVLRLTETPSKRVDSLSIHPFLEGWLGLAVQPEPENYLHTLYNRCSPTNGIAGKY